MNSAPNTEPLWTVDQVAAFLSMSKQWVYKHAELGHLPCRRFGASLRFLQSDIHKYVEQCTRRSGGRVVAFRNRGAPAQGSNPKEMENL